MIRKLLAVGDCNTLGAGVLRENSYPERVGNILGITVKNLGYTMSTTREGRRLLYDNLSDEDCVAIQFGLVDSYMTFKYSPYVLYYPDKPARKILRSLSKKFKKSCRKYGLNKMIGETNVVSADEYVDNINNMVALCGNRHVLLIDTVPNKEQYRNTEIQRYNSLLDSVASKNKNCERIVLYTCFEERMDQFYADATHCNSKGYDYIAQKVVEKIQLLG